MLVCPQCQFENLHNHPFCQQCGTPLTYSPCQNCGASVPFTEKDCPQCQHLTGKVLRAIIAEVDPDLQAWPSFGDYLDLGQRYRRIAASDDPNNGWQTIAASGDRRIWIGEVIDCRPLEPSELAVLLQYQAELLGHRAAEGEGVDELWQQLKIPTLAYPYLQLQEFIPTLPRVYDAWQTVEWEVLLLPDRSTWLSLSDLIQQGQSPRLQTVYWLNEMVALWKALDAGGYHQSLLQADNLKIDEDQILGLCQLYPNLQSKPPSLVDLARFWQDCVLASVVEPNTSDTLLLLCDCLITGEIATLSDLRLQLQDLADAEQPANLQRDREAEIAKSLKELSADLDNLNSGPRDPVTTMSEVDDLSTAVLPMELLSLEEVGATDRGRQRNHNEDCFGIYSQLHRQQTNQHRKLQGRGVYMVCDGMGGHAAGEVASALAVEALQQYFGTYGLDKFPTTDIIKEGIWEANQKLYEVNQQNASMGSDRMGTTLVMMLIHNTKVAIAHVGDSRLYRVTRKWGLEQLTVDHEVGQKAIQSGLDPKIAYSRPDAYQLTQALGPHDNEYVQPDVRFLELQEDTLLLLCSDGLSDNDLIEDSWNELLLPLLSSQLSLEQGMKKLIEFANQYNGHDNISGILIRLKVCPVLAI
jgi:protein phosphatase